MARFSGFVRASSGRWSPRRRARVAVASVRWWSRRARPAGAKAASRRSTPIRSTCRPEWTAARRYGYRAGEPQGRVVGPPATSTSTFACNPTSATCATATTSSRSSRSRSPKPPWGRRSSSRRSTVTRRSPFPPVRSRASSSCCASEACRACRAAAGVTCGPSSSSRCRRNSPSRRPNCCANSPSCAANRSAPRTRDSSPASSRRSRDAHRSPMRASGATEERQTACVAGEP